MASSSFETYLGDILQLGSIGCLTKDLIKLLCRSNTKLLHVLRELGTVGGTLIIVLVGGKEACIQLGLRISIVGDGGGSLLVVHAATSYGASGRVLALVHGARRRRTSALRVRLDVGILNASLLQN